MIRRALVWIVLVVAAAGCGGLENNRGGACVINSATCRFVGDDSDCRQIGLDEMADVVYHDGKSCSEVGY